MSRREGGDGRLTIHEAAGGDEGILRLARAWHRRCLEDPIVSHAFSHPGQHPKHVERLAAYWAEQLGGSSRYTDVLGDHSHVVRLHSGEGEHQEMDRRAAGCFAGALDDAGISADPQLRRTLLDWWGWMTSKMNAYPDSANRVPAGLPLPRWSWDGPVSE